MDVSKITMADVSTEWLNMKKLTVKQSTFSRYYSVVKTEILPDLGSIRLKDMNSSIVNSFTGRKLAGDEEHDKPPLAGKTVRDICSILKSIIKYGEKEYHTGPLAENTVLPKTRREIIETLNETELKNLTDYLLAHQDEDKHAGLLLCLYSGMRIGDADGKISLNQQKPSKHAGLRRFGPEKFLQRNNEFMKERPIFYKKPIKTEKDFSTWLRCFYYTTKAVITEYIYF